MKLCNGVLCLPSWKPRLSQHAGGFASRNYLDLEHPQMKLNYFATCGLSGAVLLSCVLVCCSLRMIAVSLALAAGSDTVAQPFLHRSMEIDANSPNPGLGWRSTTMAGIFILNG